MDAVEHYLAKVQINPSPDQAPPFQMIPVFPVRSFRHSAIYINKASGVERPQDLNDRASRHGA